MEIGIIIKNMKTESQINVLKVLDKYPKLKDKPQVVSKLTSVNTGYVKFIIKENGNINRK